MHCRMHCAWGLDGTHVGICGELFVSSQRTHAQAGTKEHASHTTKLIHEAAMYTNYFGACMRTGPCCWLKLYAPTSWRVTGL
jgi:hypothetical protein